MSSTFDVEVVFPSNNIDVVLPSNNADVTFPSHDISLNLLDKTINMTLGQVGPTGQGVPIGGTANQVLVKNSSTNYDTSWQTSTTGISKGFAIAMALALG